jgi:hypothetical protein
MMVISLTGILVIFAVALIGFGLFRRRWGFVLVGLMVGAVLWILTRGISFYIRR